MVPERMPGRQRFFAEDVEGGARELPVVERRQQVGLDHQLAAPAIDDIGAFGQGGEGPCVEQAVGLRCEGQDADQDVAACQEALELARADEVLDPVDAAPGPRPAGDVVA